MARAVIRPPRLRTRDDDAGGRHATWLETFFDLIFVVAVTELASGLDAHLAAGRAVMPPALVGFAALFVPVWWAWVGTTFYADRFDTDDLAQRLLTFVQICAVAALAFNVRDAFGATAVGFALSYVAVRAVLVLGYLRAGRSVVAARPLTTRYARGFGLAGALWLLSVAVPPPGRFLLWAVGLALDIGTGLFAGRLHARLAPDAAHLPERFAQFTLIALGESVAAVVAGIPATGWTISSALSALLGLALAFGLWWLYFDHVDGAPIRDELEAGHVAVYQVWLYAHLPLVVGLVAASVGVQRVVAGRGAVVAGGDRWLVCGSVALCLVALGVIARATMTPTAGRRGRAWAAGRVAAAALVALIGVVGARLPPVALVGAVALVCALTVGLEVGATAPP